MPLFAQNVVGGGIHTYLVRLALEILMDNLQAIHAYAILNTLLKFLRRQTFGASCKVDQAG